MSAEKYPRVLVIGQSFDLNTGGGITASNLFHDWPKDRLASVSDLKFAPNWITCQNYYRLGASEYHYRWPFSRLFKHRRSSGPIESLLAADKPSDRSPTDRWQEHTGHVRKQNVLWKMLYAFDDWFGSEQVVRGIRTSSQLLAWVKSFNPDLIYTQAASLQVMHLTMELLKEIQVPLAIHMMDDWPATLYKQQLLAPYLRWRLKREFLELLERSSLFMGISPKMCVAYEQRYQRSCVPFHNPVDLSEWLPVSKKDWQASAPFRIMYRGRIGNAVYKSLSEICDAVLECYQDGLPVRFDMVLTPVSDEKTKHFFERPGCVFVQPPGPYKEVPQSLASADLLVLPYDFDAASVRFIRYSMPTKAPEYMMSGTPILLYAPPDLAVSEYARDGRWGYLVSKQGVPELKRAISDLVSNQALREKLGRCAQSLAIENHDAIKVRAAFRQVLADAAFRGSVDQNKL